MPRITKTQRIGIHTKTKSVLNRLLTFYVSFSSLEYIYRTATSDWRELEEQLHNDYPIKGAGVKATRNNLKSCCDFMHMEEDLYPGEVPAELQSYPYQEASAAYIFTLLEGYGDDIVELINPGHLKVRQAWHHGVYGDANLKDKIALARAKEGFTKPFKCAPNKVSRFAVQRLVKIKAIRNEFMHEGSANVNFNDFLANVVGTVASIYFMLLPTETELSVYPYDDYSEKWV